MLVGRGGCKTFVGAGPAPSQGERYGNHDPELVPAFNRPFLMLTGSVALQNFHRCCAGPQRSGGEIRRGSRRPKELGMSYRLNTVFRCVATCGDVSSSSDSWRLRNKNPNTIGSVPMLGYRRKHNQLIN
jgi:hypothetical protein